MNLKPGHTYYNLNRYFLFLFFDCYIIKSISFTKQSIKMKKGFIIPLFLIVPMILLNAQTRDANVSFDFEVHNFGKIKEVDGPVAVKFQFTNTGSQPLLIKGVRASCGCTSPDWSKEPILPGKTGFVSATYNPKNRPGPFSKTVTVSSNASTPTKVLTIKGNVEPKPQTLEDVYRYNMGNKIRLKTNHMSFARVVKDKTGSQQVEIVNVSDQPVQISFDRVPKHLKLVAKPETLKPGEKGLIDGIYDSRLKNDWGFVIDRVNVMLDGQQNASNRLTVSATIEEDFGALSEEEKANAPAISFDNNTFDFTDIKQGDKVEHTFTISNNGKSDLFIRKVKASCGCTAVSPTDDVIPAGKSTTMKVIFDSRGKVGKQNKTITVISNDPRHPRSILWVKGVVVQATASVR